MSQLTFLRVHKAEVLLFWLFIRCNQCGRSSALPSRFYELELNIQGHKSLTECVTEFLKVSVIQLHSVCRWHYCISLFNINISHMLANIRSAQFEFNCLLNVLTSFPCTHLCRRRSWMGKTATSVRRVRVSRMPPEGSSCTAFLQPSTCSSCALSSIGQPSLCIFMVVSFKWGQDIN